MISSLSKICKEKDYAWSIGQTRISGRSMYECRVYYMDQAKDEYSRKKGRERFIVIQVGSSIDEAVNLVIAKIK